MRRNLSLFMCIVVISLFFMVLAVQAQTPCPSACTCMLPSDAGKLKGYTLCGGKQVICGYDNAKNPLYCYQKPAPATTAQKPAPTTTATTKTPSPTPTLAQAVVITASPSKCPSSCSCLLPSEAKDKGYTTLCGGKQVVCGYDQQQNAKYCYEQPATTAPVVTTTRPTTTPTTLPVTTCPSACSCLLPADAKKGGYTSCDGKQTICGYDNDKSPRYCYSAPGTPATLPSSQPVTTTEVVLPYQTLSRTVQATEMPTSPLQSPAGGMPPIYETPVSSRPTPGETVPQGLDQQETRQDENGGIISTIMGFFGSLFGRERPPQSTVSQQILCNGTLVDIMSDPANCGGCDMLCPRGSCVGGVCRDETGLVSRPCGIHQVSCSGVCTDIWFDERNCGNCTQSCERDETCCSGYCVNLSTSQNCGSCGNVCHLGASCSGDECICHDRERQVCNGYCLDLQTDADNCGSCGNECSSGMTCCAGTCADTTRDRRNCGECGNQCEGAETCVEGRCIDTTSAEYFCGSAGVRCGYDETCCNSRCVSTDTDEDNCGSCGNECSGGDECCDGACKGESDYASDRENCGGCGNTCPYNEDSCCNGACTDTSSNDDHCGSCSNSCAWDEFCSWPGRCVSYWDYFWENIF